MVGNGAPKLSKSTWPYMEVAREATSSYSLFQRDKRYVGT